MRTDDSITVVPTDDHVDTSAHVVLRGTANAAGDPHYHGHGSPIIKRLALADLPLTIGRWLLMGREVTSVHTYWPPPVEGSCEVVA